MSGIASPTGLVDRSGGIVLPSYGIVSPGGIFAPPLTPPDPLEGIPFTLLARTHNGSDAATDILPNEDDENPTFGPFSQATVANQGLTKIENGTPVLEFDGVNDFYLSSLASGDIFAEGSFAIAIKPLAPLSSYSTAVGGGPGSPALLIDGTTPAWGLGSPGGFVTVEGITLTTDEWFVFIARWTGTAYKYTTWQDGVTTEDTATAPGGFNPAATGFIGLGAHVSDAPFSYIKARYVASGVYTEEWTDDQVDTILAAFINLLPNP